MMSLDQRTGRAVVLTAWAAFLIWLQASGQVARYLGPRTAWIVPVGGLLLAASAAGYLLRTTDSPEALRPLRGRDVLGFAAVLAPAFVALCLSDATLGSLAAANKLGSRGIDAERLARSLRADAGHLDFLVLRGADEDPTFARERGIEPGAPVRLTGFVYKSGTPLRLARFYITCCVADSVAMDVPVYGVRAYPKDTWLTVTGVLARRNGHLAVVGAQATPTHAPAHPYLVFRV